MPEREETFFSVIGEWFEEKFPKIKTWVINHKKGLKRVGVYFIALWLIYMAFFVYIRPNENGVLFVRANWLGIRAGEGVQEKLLETGLNLRIPLMETMERFPKDVLVYDLTQFPTEKTRGITPATAAHIQTSDGFYTDVDVSIVYYIEDPYLTYTTIGPGTLYESSGIIPKVEAFLKSGLGELTVEDFYNSPKRYEMALLSKDMMNKDLNPMGIVVKEVLIRYYKLPEEIQDKIEKRKEQDQLLYTRESEARAEEANAELTRIKEEGEANVKVKKAEGDAYKTRKDAEADLYMKRKKADGDLLVLNAEAYRKNLVANALIGSGSKYIVGMEMAKSLQRVTMVILPSEQYNPLDMFENLFTWGVR